MKFTVTNKRASIFCRNRNHISQYRLYDLTTHASFFKPDEA